MSSTVRRFPTFFFSISFNASFPIFRSFDALLLNSFIYCKSTSNTVQQLAYNHTLCRSKWFKKDILKCFFFLRKLVFHINGIAVLESMCRECDRYSATFRVESNYVLWSSFFVPLSNSQCRQVNFFYLFLSFKVKSFF